MLDRSCCGLYPAKEPRSSWFDPPHNKSFGEEPECKHQVGLHIHRTFIDSDDDFVEKIGNAITFDGSRVPSASERPLGDRCVLSLYCAR